VPSVQALQLSLQLVVHPLPLVVGALAQQALLQLKLTLTLLLLAPTLGLDASLLLGPPPLLCLDGPLAGLGLGSAALLNSPHPRRLALLTRPQGGLFALSRCLPAGLLGVRSCLGGGSLPLELLLSAGLLRSALPRLLLLALGFEPTAVGIGPGGPRPSVPSGGSGRRPAMLRRWAAARR